MLFFFPNLLFLVLFFVFESLDRDSLEKSLSGGFFPSSCHVQRTRQIKFTGMQTVMGKKIVFSRNITNIRPIRMMLFLKCSARYALSIRQIGTEIGQVFVAFQTKEEKTTKVSIVMRRQLLRNEYTSDSSGDSTNR